MTANSSGQQTALQTYYPYGAVRTGSLPTDYSFTGQKLDTSDSLLYYGARYYAADIGRFAQPDSIIADLYNPQSLNRYSYVRNNPVRYTDPTGHCEGDPEDPEGSDAACWKEVRRIEHDFSGIHIDPASWTTGELQTVYKALDRFSSSVGGVEAAMNAIGGVTIAMNNGEFVDENGQLYAGTSLGTIRLPHAHFHQPLPRQVLGPEIGIAHELAHYWDNNWANPVQKVLGSGPLSNGLVGGLCDSGGCESGPTAYGRSNAREEWAETVAIWVYPEYVYIILAEQGTPWENWRENYLDLAGFGGPGLGGLHASYLLKQIHRLGGW